MRKNTLTLLAALLALAATITGCGKDEPEPPKENFGAGLGKSYNGMLDEAKQAADAANQHMQETQDRIREQR